MNANNSFLILCLTILPFYVVLSLTVADKALCDLQGATTFTNKSSIIGWDCINGVPITPVCSWTGCTCSNSVLESINLNSHSLAGTIPTSIGNILSLTSISLNNNQLHGSIPTSLGLISSLEVLSLQSNAFTGTLPEEFAKNSKLNQLLIYSNSLIGSIPESLCTLPLDILEVQSNQFTCYQTCFSIVDVFTSDNIPLCSTAGQLSSGPSSQPNGPPSSVPTSSPTFQPTRSYSSQPLSQPSLQPSSQPNLRASDQPSSQPVSYPSPMPTYLPTLLSVSTMKPTLIPQQSSLNDTPTTNMTESVKHTRNKVKQLELGVYIALIAIASTCVILGILLMIRFLYYYLQTLSIVESVRLTVHFCNHVLKR